MEKNVPTILKSYLQSCMLLGQEYSILDNSTLNQKLNILAEEVPNTGEIPRLKYVVLGNGGLSIQTGTDGFAYTQTYSHKSTDAGLFNELPFIVRPVLSDDFPNKDKYRLRKLLTIGGSSYVAYYGKVLDFGSNTAALQRRSVENNGTVTTTNFIPSPSDLNPTPTVLDSGETVTTIGEYVSSSTQLDFILSPNDVLELLNSSVLIYGNENHAIISEIALCSGVDKPVTGIPGYDNEAIAVQVMSFLSTNFPAPSWSQGVKYTFDIGNSEPLLAVE